MSLLLPVGPRRMSSWEDHQERRPPSKEAGTDFYCPIGTPVRAPETGRVYGWGNSIIPATGRWVGLDLITGQRFRAMHFSRIELSQAVLNRGGFVRKGEIIAYSGASGYGQENWENDPYTGGAHTHVTLWPTQETKFGYRPNGKPYTVDFMKYAEASGSSSGGNELPIKKVLETDVGNPIVNVVPKYGDDPNAAGTLWIGNSATGKFDRYLPPYDPNVRGVISHVFYGDQEVPTINQRDFQTVDRLWRTMCGKA